MDFKTWIAHFKDVDRPIGDLAKDIERDSNFPNQNNRKIIHNYLKQNANPRIVSKVLETFNNAWEYYLKDRP